MKNFISSFYILISLHFLFSCTGKENKKESSQIGVKNRDSLKSVITLIPEPDNGGGGGIPFNGLKNSRNYMLVVDFRNGNRSSKVFYHPKASVLYTWEGVDEVKNYILFGNDTLKIKVNGKVKTQFTGNRKNDILNIIKHNDIGNYKRMLIPSDHKKLQQRIQDIENEYKLQLDESMHFLNTHVLSAREYNILKTFLYIAKINSIFNINYKNISLSDIQLLYPYYSEVCNSIDRINTIETSLNRRVLFNLLNYAGAKNGYYNKSEFDNLKFLDSRFYKTEIMDGYFYDAVNDCKSKKEKLMLIEKLRPYMLKSYTEKEVTAENIEFEVLRSGFTDAGLKKSSLGQILETDKQLVLIDVWASWCVPCIKEIPRLQELRRKYNNEVKFVSLSIDTDRRKWENVLLKYNLSGKDSYIMNKKTTGFISGFKINSVPRFILIDNRKRVIATDFYRPSDSVFELKLEEHLK